MRDSLHLSQQHDVGQRRMITRLRILRVWTIALALNLVMTMRARVKSSLIRHLRSRSLFIAIVSVFFTTPSHANESEVAVTGCVVDFGGKRYKNIDVELKGLNYRGGAGYTNNNSVAVTDIDGEFSVRMKAGEPPPGQPTTAQVRATIERQFAVHGWSGQASDVSQQINVSNIGKPIDLRSQGCLRYPWPISVGGEITSGELDEKADDWVKVRFTAGGSSDRLAVWIRGGPLGSITLYPFDLKVSLSEGDRYKVDIPEQPKGARCDILAGTSGVAGEKSSTEERGQNYWVTNPIRIHCERREIEPEEPRLPAEVLPRRGGNSGAALFQNAIDQAEQDERNRPAREARERVEQARVAAEQARLAREQQANTANDSAGSASGVASGILSIFGAVRDAKAARGGGAAGAAAPSGRGTIPACVPGNGYDAKKCSCALNPTNAGCSGAAPRSYDSRRQTCGPNRNQPCWQ